MRLFLFHCVFEFRYHSFQSPVKTLHRYLKCYTCFILTSPTHSSHLGLVRMQTAIIFLWLRRSHEAHVTSVDRTSNVNCYLSLQEARRICPWHFRRQGYPHALTRNIKNTTILPVFPSGNIPSMTFLPFAPFTLLVEFAYYNFSVWDNLVVSMYISV